MDTREFYKKMFIIPVMAVVLFLILRKLIIFMDSHNYKEIQK